MGPRRGKRTGETVYLKLSWARCIAKWVEALVPLSHECTTAVDACTESSQSAFQHAVGSPTPNWRLYGQLMVSEGKRISFHQVCDSWQVHCALVDSSIYRSIGTGKIGVDRLLNLKKKRGMKFQGCGGLSCRTQGEEMGVNMIQTHCMASSNDQLKCSLKVNLIDGHRHIILFYFHIMITQHHHLYILVFNFLLTRITVFTKKPKMLLNLFHKTRGSMHEQTFIVQ